MGQFKFWRGVWFPQISISLILDTNKCSVYNWSMIHSEGKLMEEQKETYREMLHKIIDSIDNADYLLYLIIFIQEKFKAG